VSLVGFILVTWTVVTEASDGPGCSVLVLKDRETSWIPVAARMITGAKVRGTSAKRRVTWF